MKEGVLMVYVVGLSVIFVMIYIIIEHQKRPLLALMVKGFASLSFIIVFAAAVYGRVQFIDRALVSLVLLGLVSGLLGDLYLALRPLRPKAENEQIILGGITAFSVGHLFYLFALISLSGFHVIAIPIAIIMTIVVILGSKFMKFQMGIAKYPTYFYSLLIFLMIGSSLGHGLAAGFGMFEILMFLGAILFGISDLILAPIYYQGKDTKLMITLNLMTYYAAQILIALSIYFIPNMVIQL
jgi:uncharacterized membrane protein YhhN